MKRANGGCGWGERSGSQADDVGAAGGPMGWSPGTLVEIKGLSWKEGGGQRRGEALDPPVSGGSPSKLSMGMARLPGTTGVDALNNQLLAVLEATAPRVAATAGQGLQRDVGLQGRCFGMNESEGGASSEAAYASLAAKAAAHLEKIPAQERVSVGQVVFAFRHDAAGTAGGIHEVLGFYRKSGRWLPVPDQTRGCSENLKVLVRDVAGDVAALQVLRMPEDIIVRAARRRLCGT